MAADLILSLLAGLGGAGRGFVTEEREQREQTRKEEETRANIEHQAFERAATAEKLFHNALDTTRQLPMNLRPQALDAMLSGIKKLGGTLAPGLRDRLLVDEQFSDLYQRSIKERRILPELAAHFGPGDQKMLEDLRSDIEGLKKADARQKAAGGVFPGQPGSALARSALETGVNPSEVGLGNIPFFPPAEAGPSGEALLARMRFTAANTLRKLRLQAQNQPFEPFTPEEIPFTGLRPTALERFVAGGFTQEDLAQILLSQRGRVPAPEPAAPVPAPTPPAGAGTGGGAVPQRGGAAPTLTPEQRTKVEALKPGATVRMGGKVYTREQLLGK